MTDISYISEAILDLIPPETLLTIIKHNIAVFYEDEWEPRHQVAGAQLCNYVLQTYGEKSSVGKSAQFLLNLITAL